MTSTTSTRQVTPELVAFLRKREADLHAWIAEDPANRGGGCYPTDDESLAQLAEEGITTIEDYNRRELVIAVYDGWKDVYGSRPDYAWVNSWSNQELEDTLDRWRKHYDEEKLEAKRRLDTAWVEARELASRLGQSVKTLIRWGVLDKRELYPA